MLVCLETFSDKKHRFSLSPDIICKSIVDVDFIYLKKAGITACFIDLDGTVVSRGTFEVDPRIAKVLAKSGLTIHLATNRPKSRSLKNLKKDLSATTVIHPHGFYGKPSKRYYSTALKELKLKPQQVVMIGDRYIQDILGANRAGIYSLLVYKLGATQGRIDAHISKLEKTFTTRISANYTETK